MKAPTILLALWLLPTLGSSQTGSWEYIVDSAGVSDYFSDVIWNGERFLLVRQSALFDQFLGTYAGTQVIAVESNGALSNTYSLNWSPRVLASQLLQRPSSSESDLMTRVRIDNDEWFNVRVGLDASGSLIDSTWIYAGVYDNYFAENAVRASDGGILIALGGIPTGGFWSSIFTLLRLDASGEFAGQTQITDPDLGQNYPYSIIELSTATILVGNHGLLVENGSPFNFCSLSAFDQNLQPIGGMALMAIDGSSDPPGAFNTLSSRIHLQQLSGDTILIAGRTGSGGPGSRFAVMKVHWPTSTWLASYLPLSDTPADHPAITQSISVEPDGTILAAYMENYQIEPTPYLPQFPNRVHVVRLDRDLNPICSQVIDGHADNAYYFPYRIKSTPDGGYLVLGGRWNFDEPQMGFAAWARKFEATDCATDLTEIEPSPNVLAYPNPGTDHIIFTLNDGRGYAQAELFDAQGRRCLQTPVLQGTARMDVVHLSAGIYHWRMIDSKGELIGHGNWVKGN
jgi:hypothetical protein